MWWKKSFLSLFPVTNSTGSLLFEPTSQLILEDPRAFEWILPPMLKKNYREGGFIWNVQETSKIQRETHSRDKTKQCDVSRKKTLRPSSFCEGTFSLIIFPRNKNSFGSLVSNQRVNWFGKIQVHETSNRPLRTEQSFVSRKFHERQSRDKTKRCNISGKKLMATLQRFSEILEVITEIVSMQKLSFTFVIQDWVKKRNRKIVKLPW